MKEQSQQQSKPTENNISPGLSKILDDEEKEGRIQTAIDAALEEGYLLTREEVEKIIFPTDIDSSKKDTESEND